MTCVFCEIVAGREPASFVWRDGRVVAFLSLEQPNPYKVLVVPRAHVETIYDLDDDLAACVFQAAVRVARAVRSVAGCPGLNLVQANGAAGQQDVFHFHLHVVPRLPGDRVTLRWPNVQRGRSELDRLAADLRAVM
jgi:histidine triad (HIT) family protein